LHGKTVKEGKEVLMQQSQRLVAMIMRLNSDTPDRSINEKIVKHFHESLSTLKEFFKPNKL
jgi:methylphosphotriester-DNA--protein-cysteine methyltransferase